MSSPPKAPGLIPRNRADALTDGLFAIVMTILVLDLHLPAHQRYRSATDLWSAINGLESQLIAYAISFFVAASFWSGHVSLRSKAEFLPSSHTRWWMLHLFTMTLLPVATGIVGNFTRFAPAVWVYSAVMLLAALTSWRMAATYPERETRDQKEDGFVKLAMVALAAIVSSGISLVSPQYAMLAYLLIAATPLIMKLLRRHRRES